jgi:hypothetical protein
MRLLLLAVAATALIAVSGCYWGYYYHGEYPYYHRAAYAAEYYEPYAAYYDQAYYDAYYEPYYRGSYYYPRWHVGVQYAWPVIHYSSHYPRHYPRHYYPRYRPSPKLRSTRSTSGSFLRKLR